MSDNSKNYPNVTWDQFAVCNDNKTGAFEDMTRRLFCHEFLKDYEMPHSDHNNTGVEVLPILEPPHKDDSPRKKISFQSKYFEYKIDYSQIKHSANKTVEYYKGELDLVYLFCNKTITTNAKGYKAVEEILLKAGMELKPISNKELLDLAVKYKEEANYFFLQRKPPEGFPITTVFPCISSLGISSSVPSCVSENHCVINIDPKLLENLVLEKVTECRSHIFALEFTELKNQLDKIFMYRLDGIKGASKLYFFRALNCIHCGDEYQTYDAELGETLKTDVCWLADYYKRPVVISSYQFGQHLPEVQVLILDKMFTAQLWENIIKIYVEICTDADPIIMDSLKLYYGLALFNTHHTQQASDILNSLYLKTGQKKILLYATFSDIQKINKSYREGRYDKKEELVKLLERLDTLKNYQQYKANILLVALLRLEAEFNLGIKEKKYIEKAVEEYSCYEEKIKKNLIVKYMYGLCLEIEGNIDEAIKVYSELDWKTDEAAAIRYMTCHLFQNNPEETIRIYNEIDKNIKSTRVFSVYLSALYRKDRLHFQSELEKALNQYKEKPHDLISIAFGIEDKEVVRKTIIPSLEPLLTEKVIKGLDYQEKAKILVCLATGGEIRRVDRILASIDDITGLNRFVIHTVYKALFEYCNKEYMNHGRLFIESENLDASERIADRFLENGIQRREFIQIKYLCAGAKEKRFSMLKYAKELFEITQDPEMARNIIGMLFEKGETEEDAYGPYIDVLSKSDYPKYSMAVASAMLRLGREEDAEFYAYKALYYLNDQDDYEIFKSYFGFHNYSLNNYHTDKVIKSVHDVHSKAVVILEGNIPTKRDKSIRLEICLDPESEFDDLDNRSLGVKHINSKNTIFFKLRGSSLNQILNIEGVGYKVIQIIPRSSWAMRYIFQKINEHPDKFEGVAWVISTNNPQEMIEQIKALTDQTDQMGKLLKAYNFEDNDSGLPLDIFTGGDYDKYADVLSVMLHAQDQAFYTGYPTYENEEGQKYVPDISTLVLLSLMNLFDVLSAVKNDIILPSSYMSFFQERYSKAIEKGNMSVGTMYNIDGKLTIVENDIRCADVWEKILQFCDGLNICEVTDDDRIGFMIGNDINGEQLISALCLTSLHLDAFVVAAKKELTYLCDDLFFRKLATYGKMRNINFVSLLQHYVNDDFVVPIIMELSKTNYLYIPLYVRTDEEAIELKKNILNGKLKKKYYGIELVRRMQIFKAELEQAFAEMYNDDSEIPNDLQE